MDLFAVVLDQYEHVETAKLSALLQGNCGVNRIDAQQRAAGARGIVAEKLSVEQATNLQAALHHIGYRAAAVPQKVVPPPVKARRVQLLSPSPEGLGVRWVVTGKPRFYPWSDVLIFSAAVVFHEQKEQVIRSEETLSVSFGKPTAIRTVTETKIDTRDVSRDAAMATITLGNLPMSLEHLRLRATEMEYATIFGPKVRSTPLENFCLLLAMIGNQATNATITDQTAELIAAAQGSPRLPKEPRFESENEFDHYQRWLVTKRLVG